MERFYHRRDTKYYATKILPQNTIWKNKTKQNTIQVPYLISRGQMHADHFLFDLIKVALDVSFKILKILFVIRKYFKLFC